MLTLVSYRVCVRRGAALTNAESFFWCSALGHDTMRAPRNPAAALAAALLTLLLASPSARAAAPYVADVTAFGAKGDGVTRDTAAIAAAVAAVAAHGGGVLLFPTGTYLTAPLNLTSDLEVRLANATLLAVTDWASWPIVAPLPSYGRGRDFPGPRYGAFLSLNNLTRVRIVGEGGADANFVDGQGEGWWLGKKNGSLTVTPGHLLETMWSEDVEISDVTFVDSPFWFTHVWSSRRVWVHDMKVRAPRDSPNTDGIDPDSSSDVLIERIDVINGDDCIAIKSGWDQPGVTYGVPSTNITFRDNVCDSGNCVAIGSEMSGGVSDVFLSNISCVRGGQLLNVKSTLGRGGYIRNVHLSNSTVVGKVGVALRAADNYGDNNGPINSTLVPQIDGIFCSHIRSAPGAVLGAAGFFEGLGDTPEAGKIVNVVLDDVVLAAAPAGSWRCTNVSGTSTGVSPAPCAALQG